MHGTTNRGEERPLRLWFEADTLRQGVHLSAALRTRGWPAAEVWPPRTGLPHERWIVAATTPPVTASPATVRCLERYGEDLARRLGGCRFVRSEPV
jgi:hypothetical protein